MPMVAFGYPTKELALERFVDKMTAHAESQGDPPYDLDEMDLKPLSDTGEIEVIRWALDGVGVGVTLGYIVEMKGVYFPAALIDELFGGSVNQTQIML